MLLSKINIKGKLNNNKENISGGVRIEDINKINNTI